MMPIKFTEASDGFFEGFKNSQTYVGTMRSPLISLESIILLSFLLLLNSTDVNTRSKEVAELIGKPPDPSDRVILRKKRTIKYEDLPLSLRKRLAENLQTISDYEDDMDENADNSMNLDRENREITDFDEHSMDKRETGIEEEEEEKEEDNNEKSFKNSGETKKIEEINHINSMRSDARKKRDKTLKTTQKNKANLEIAKSELEEVEKKVEKEIRNLKKRSKSSKNSEIKNNSKKRQINYQNLSTHPRLLKIEVDTFEIGQEAPKNEAEAVGRSKKSEINSDQQIGVKRRFSSDSEAEEKEKNREKEVEDVLQRRIDNVKEQVRRKVEEESKIKEIEANNAKYDELMRLEEENVEEEVRNDEREKRLDEEGSSDAEGFNAVDDEGPDVFEEDKKVHESIKKRSAPVYDDADEEIETRRKRNPISRGFRSSVDAGINSKMEIPRLKANRYYRRSKGASEMKNKLKYMKSRGNDYKRQSFLFPGRLHRRKRRDMRFDRRKLGSYKRKRGGRAKHKHRRQVERVIDEDKRRGRFGRAADGPLDEIQSDSVAEPDAIANIANSQDVGSQLAPEYQEAFGGLPNESGASLTRYKRIKRTS